MHNYKAEVAEEVIMVCCKCIKRAYKVLIVEFLFCFGFLYFVELKFV